MNTDKEILVNMSEKIGEIHADVKVLKDDVHELNERQDSLIKKVVRLDSAVTWIKTIGSTCLTLVTGILAYLFQK